MLSVLSIPAIFEIVLFGGLAVALIVQEFKKNERQK